MSHAIAAILIATLAGIALRGDAAPEKMLPLVLYLGHGPTNSDPGFRFFADALARAHPDRFARTRLGYLSISDQAGGDARVLTRAQALKPAVIVAPTAGSMRLARRMKTIPAVFSSYMDPIRSGFVESLQIRSDPVTGIDAADELDGKRLEILYEAYPRVRSVAILADPEWASDDEALRRVESQGRALGIRTVVLLADTEDELKALFARASSQGYDAWYVPPTYLQERFLELIVSTMRQWRKPCIYSETFAVRSGGLMSYAQDTSFAWRAMANLVVRVLNGEPPNNIPIQRPKDFELAVRVTPDVSIAPPAPSVLLRADVIVR